MMAKKPLLSDGPDFIDDVIIGSSHVQITRKLTGLYSLDVALSSGGSLGMPLRCLVEVYGHPHVGKSTLTYYLSGVMASRGTIDLCDLEGLDPNYLHSVLMNAGFRGTVKIIPNVDKGRPRKHTEMVNEMAGDLLESPATNAIILDSIGAFVPTAESEGDIGESFMGRRALAVAQFVRRISTYLIAKEQNGMAFIINHVHSVIGGQGHVTAGGDTLKYMSAVRIMLWQKQMIKSGEDILGYWVGGKIEKLRYGGKGREFQFVLLPDYGVSRELSAMFDCFELGLAERGTHVKIGDKSFGFISKLIEQAKDGNHDKFNPFYELLEGHRDKRILGNTATRSEAETET